MATRSNFLSVRTAVLLFIPLLLAMLWGFPGAGKLLGGGIPTWFTDQFGKTILATAPGMTISFYFYSIAVLEAVASLLALASLLRGEFIRPVSPVLLYLSLILSLALFVQLSVGKQLVSDFAGIHDLFMYFAGTLVMLLVIRSFDTDTRPVRS